VRAIVLLVLARVVWVVALAVTVAWFLGYTGLGAALIVLMTGHRP
jgi:hypothetical protein